MAITYRNLQDATGLHFDNLKALERKKVFNLDMDALPATHAICRYLYSSKIKTLGVGDLDPAQELARRNKEMADKLAMANQEKRAELIPEATVAALVLDAFGKVRTRLLSLPTKLAIRVVGLKSAAEVQNILNDGINDTLAELSEQAVLDAAGVGYAGRVIDEVEVVDGAEATAEADTL